LLAAAFAHGAVASVVADADGAVVAVSGAFCALTGLSQEQVRGGGLRLAVHPDHHQELEAASRALVTGEASLLQLQLRCVRADAAVLWCQVDLVRLEDDDGAVHVLAQVQETTGRRRAEQLETRSSELLALVRAVGLACTAADDPGAAHLAVLDAVCSTAGWDTGRVLLPAAGAGWTVAAHRSGPAARRLLHAATELAAPDGTPRAVQLAAADDGASWLRVGPAGGPGARRDGVLLVGVPVLVDHELAAVLEFVSAPAAAEPDGPLLAVLHDVGVQLGRVLERERTRAAQAASAARQRSIVEHAGDGYVETDEHGTITDWNPEAQRMFGWAAAEVLGRRLAEVVVPARLRDAHEQGMVRARAGRSRLAGQRVQLQALHRDGHEFPVELSLSVLPEGAGWTCQGFVRDLTEASRLTEQLAEQQRFLDAVLASMTDGVFACDRSGRLTLVNRAYQELFAVPDDPRPPEQWLADLLLFEADGVTPMPPERSPLFRALGGETVRDTEIVVGRPGAYRRLRCHARPLIDEAGQLLGAMCGARDVTEQVAAERALKHLQRHDALSGLPNGSVLLERLHAAAGPGRRTLVQLYVEDLATAVAAEGLEVGQELLREVGRRLREAVRSGDLVAHLGAERFAVLLRHDARTDPRHLVERLLHAFAEPWERGRRSTRLSVTAGLASVHRTDVATAVSSSELALQIARAAGPGTSRSSTPGWPSGCGCARRCRPTWSAPSRPGSSRCATSRRWSSPAGGSEGSRRCCAGSTRREGSCVLTTSCRRPRRRD
jgi:PAS domain S-box-containing protein